MTTLKGGMVVVAAKGGKIDPLFFLSMDASTEAKDVPREDFPPLAFLDLFHFA